MEVCSSPFSAKRKSFSISARHKKIGWICQWKKTNYFWKTFGVEKLLVKEDGNICWHPVKPSLAFINNLRWKPKKEFSLRRKIIRKRRLNLICFSALANTIVNKIICAVKHRSNFEGNKWGVSVNYRLNKIILWMWESCEDEIFEIM